MLHRDIGGALDALRLLLAKLRRIVSGEESGGGASVAAETPRSWRLYNNDDEEEPGSARSDSNASFDDRDLSRDRDRDRESQSSMDEATPRGGDGSKRFFDDCDPAARPEDVFCVMLLLRQAMVVLCEVQVAAAASSGSCSSRAGGAGAARTAASATASAGGTSQPGSQSTVLSLETVAGLAEVFPPLVACLWGWHHRATLDANLGGGDSGSGSGASYRDYPHSGGESYDSTHHTAADAPRGLKQEHPLHHQGIHELRDTVQGSNYSGRGPHSFHRIEEEEEEEEENRSTSLLQGAVSTAAAAFCQILGSGENRRNHSIARHSGGVWCAFSVSSI